MNQRNNEDTYKMLKCVRCGSVKNLNPYAHTTSLQSGYKRTGRVSTTEYISWTQKFPVCGLCLGEFKKRKNLTIISGVIFFIAMCFFIYGGLMTFFTPSYVYLPVIGGILTAIGIYVVIISSKIPKPKKYMNVTSGQPKVKPENSADWILFSSWAEMVLKERILQGTIDPTQFLKKGVETTPTYEEYVEEKQKKLIDELKEKNINYCPTCGNLLNLSKKQVCEVCGYENDNTT